MEEVAALFAATGKSSSALCLRLRWALLRCRLSHAVLSTQMRGITAKPFCVPEGLQQHWTKHATLVGTLSTLAMSEGMAE
eukprot:3568784-Pyramimonas_sp.AAC.1